MNNKRLRLLKDKELRNKFLADQIKIGLRYQLRSLRDSQNLTQKELAELIGTKQSVISRLERNAERVSIPTLLDIADALDVGVVVRFESIDTVLDWYNNPTQKKMTPRKSEKILKEMEEQSSPKKHIYGNAEASKEIKGIEIVPTIEGNKILGRYIYPSTLPHYLSNITDSYIFKEDDSVSPKPSRRRLDKSENINIELNESKNINISQGSYTDLTSQDFSSSELYN